jgi:hypothetical protein
LAPGVGGREDVAPGATMSTAGPFCEKGANAFSQSTAPTEMTSG